MSPIDWSVQRINDSCCTIDNSMGLDVRLFANENVAIDRDAFAELFDFLDVHRAVQDVLEGERNNKFSFFADQTVGIERVVLTPDFHKGSGIPIGTVVENTGFVIPAAIGNDICCGMRLLVTDLPASMLDKHWPELQKRLREIFFQGQRNIPMSPRQREAVLRYGLPGLLDTIKDNEGSGIYQLFNAKDQTDDLSRAFNGGGFNTSRLFGFEKLIRSSGSIDGRDPQIGSVGGGNHFVELQRIDELLCKQTARELDISAGNLAIMIHSGSVALGHAVGGHFIDRAKELFPAGIKHPKNDFYMLPMVGPLATEGMFYINSMRNAANFAFANRLFLGLMTIKAIQEVLGITIDSRLIYDAPHNLVFGKGDKFIHRKGATPAEGPTNPSEWIGKPVIIPGSMGSASYLLTGLGNEDALQSACHGAGRVMPRGEASHVSDKIFDAQTQELRIVTAIDPLSPQMQMRRDIMAKHKERVKEEAPYAYKPITPIIDSIEAAGIARPVAKLMPLLTVKG
jgi:tRNA-splicing ligase RtcB (3'-phosphate/5'-hydroxy nucleic acid ligase)